MKREEVLSLLKDLMVACETMRLALVVSLVPQSKHGHWKLSVKWINENEKDSFEKIIKERGLKATETNDGYIIFVKD
jgi:hypothetical protein